MSVRMCLAGRKVKVRSGIRCFGEAEGIETRCKSLTPHLLEKRNGVGRENWKKELGDMRIRDRCRGEGLSCHPRLVGSQVGRYLPAARRQGARRLTVVQ
jgi:hypothetical protein